MSEPSTIEQLTCARCHEPFPRAKPTGQKPKYCPRCRAITRAEISTAASARNRVLAASSIEFTCEGCNGTFPRDESPRGGRRKRCDPCRDAWVVERTARYREAGRQRKNENRRKFAPGTRTYDCTLCGTTRQCAETGRIPQYCESCAEARSRESVKQSGHERRVKLRSGPTEKFSFLEIWERDKWVCGLCRKKIDSRLEYPHPMSKSIDHIVPVTHGGPHLRANVKAAHVQCNRDKGAGFIPGGEQLLLVG